jgi:hypothetical protein
MKVFSGCTPDLLPILWTVVVYLPLDCFWCVVSRNGPSGFSNRPAFGTFMVRDVERD